jgi:uncharacterized membrane protein YphA (DoxX/SURF4 family)
MNPRNEPAGIIGLLTAVLAFVVSLNLHGLSSVQAGYIVGAVTAVGGLVVAWRTRPVAPGVITAAISALAALATAYGFHPRAAVVGAVAALAVALSSFLTRGQVSPVGVTPRPVRAE